MATMSQDGTLGILDPRRGFRHFALDRRAPPADLEEVIERFWTVRWDLAPGACFEQEILPHPCANLSSERSPVVLSPEVRVTGLSTERFVARLEGSGGVFGTKLTPGGLFAIARVPTASLVGRRASLSEVTGHDVELRDLDPRAEGDGFEEASRRMAELVRAVLTERPIDARVLRINALVARVREDRSILRVDDLARIDGGSVRQLQRDFKQVVGIGPKWVIRRARVQDAAERVANGERVDWARTAQDLGYHDQAHLIHEFRAQVGWTPEAYARRCRDGLVSRRPIEERSFA
ncbi:MAG: DUF6597 domain-containing transcriptional factor [Sandaracinaceae bacterium]